MRSKEAFQDDAFIFSFHMNHSFFHRLAYRLWTVAISSSLRRISSLSFIMYLNVYSYDYQH
ncbi:MAG: hypothetical protein LUI04_03130, partial [Porphyromonadaceae bacterium]|nr:hypothetical protein [Porphyromonadaceae bacterium]